MFGWLCYWLIADGRKQERLAKERRDAALRQREHERRNLHVVAQPKVPPKVPAVKRVVVNPRQPQRQSTPVKTGVIGARAPVRRVTPVVEEERTTTWPTTSDNDDSVLAAVALASIVSSTDDDRPRVEPSFSSGGGGDYGGGGTSSSWDSEQLPNEPYLDYLRRCAEAGEFSPPTTPTPPAEDKK